MWIYPTAANKSGYISGRLVQQPFITIHKSVNRGLPMKTAVFIPVKSVYCVPFISLPRPSLFLEARLPLAAIHQTKPNKHAFNLHLSPGIKALVVVKCVSRVSLVPAPLPSRICYLIKGMWACEAFHECPSPLTSVSTLVRPPEHRFRDRGILITAHLNCSILQYYRKLILTVGFKVTHKTQKNKWKMLE